MTADMIVSNARVLTMDDKHPRATALAVRDGIILAIGRDRRSQIFAGPDT